MKPLTAPTQASVEASAAREMVVDLIDPGPEVRYRHELARESAAAARERAWSEGYAAAIEDVKRAEHQIRDGVRLAGIRADPGGAAWLAAVERHGGTEYGGQGRPRVPVPPEVIERARRQLRGVRT